MSLLSKNVWIIWLSVALITIFIGSCVHNEYNKHMAKKYAEESKLSLDSRNYKTALTAAYKIKDNYIDNPEIREYIKQVERTTILEIGAKQGNALISSLKDEEGSTQSQSNQNETAERKAYLFDKAKRLYKAKEYITAIVVLRQLQNESQDSVTHAEVASIISQINNKIEDITPPSETREEPDPPHLPSDNYELAKDLYERCLDLRYKLSQRAKIDKLAEDAKKIRIGEYAYIAFAAGYIKQLSIEQQWEGNTSSNAAESAKIEYDRLMAKAKVIINKPR